MFVCRSKRLFVRSKKSPVDMNGQGELIASFKTSKAGRLKLVKENQHFRTVKENESGENELDLVFENGEIKRSQSFEEIRKLSSLTK
jgi:nicotinamide phosphoribosyltransferase